MDIFNQVDLTEVCQECQEFVDDVRGQSDSDSIKNFF